MDAQVGRNPSYKWRNIVAAKPVTKEGAKWVVGDGTANSLCFFAGRCELVSSGLFFAF